MTASLSPVQDSRRGLLDSRFDPLNFRRYRRPSADDMMIVESLSSLLRRTLRDSDSTFEHHVKSFEDVIPLNLGPQVSTVARLQSLALMRQKSFFELKWGSNIREADKDLCVHIMQDMVSKMDAASRDEVFQRLCFPRKRRAPDDDMNAAQSKSKQNAKHTRLNARFRQKGKQHPGTAYKLPINATQAKPRDEVGSSATKLSTDLSKKVNPTVVGESTLHIRCPSCPICNKVITVKKKRSYSHTNQKGAFYYIFQCCNKEFSHLSSLPKLRKFKKLEPACELHEWTFRNDKWRLYCRGREWTRCQHCEALFLSYTGKDQYHTKSECPLSKFAAQHCELVD